MPFIELRHEADGLEALGARVDEVERAWLGVGLGVGVGVGLGLGLAS